MKVLHITPTSNGYEDVTLIANRVSFTNHLAVIEKDGQQYFTGGYILADIRTIRAVLDITPKELQYDVVQDLRIEPFVKLYLNEDRS